jgi:hypothetical protein
MVSRDVSIPLIVCAATETRLIFHAVRQMMAVISQASGSALFAGQLNPAMTITVMIIGINAKRAYMVYSP